MKQKVLITGGAGFIGTHLVIYLLERDYPITVLDNERTGSLERLHELSKGSKNLRLVLGDIRERSILPHVVPEEGIVFHLAAQVSVVESMENPLETLDINVTGTARLLEQCRRMGISRFLFASSCAVYGSASPPPFHEEHHKEPDSTYGLSKKMGEDLCLYYARSYGLDTVALRFFNVYGSLQSHDSPYASVVPNFMKAAAHHKPMVIYGSGEQTRDFIYVRDLVKFLERVMNINIGTNRIMNVGTGNPISILKLSQYVQKATGIQVPIEHTSPRPGEMLHAHANIERMQSIIGWKPADFTPLQDALKQTWDWYRQQLDSSSPANGG